MDYSFTLVFYSIETGMKYFCSILLIDRQTDITHRHVVLVLDIPSSSGGSSSKLLLYMDCDADGV